MFANLVLYNGNIYTMDKLSPHTEAVAIAADRILAVGSNSAMRDLLAPDGKAVDLGGQTVFPGFIDAHLHFMSYGLSLREIDLIGTDSLDEAVQRVADRAATTDDESWLTGRGWDQLNWVNGFPAKADLDRVAPNHPVFLRRKCGHAGWANSRALAAAGITAGTPDPEGGEIVRDATTGEPTGILLETAMTLVGNLIAEPTHEEAVAAVRTAMDHVHKMGIVGVHNMEGAPALRAFQQLREDGELGLRLVQQIPEVDLDEAIALGIRSGFGDDWIRIGALKIFSDGALGARTALMVDPYEDEPDNYGIAVATAEHLDRQVEKAARNGLAVHIHAIGDKANRNVLDAVEKTRKAGIGLHLRHRIEHAQVLHPDDLARFVELGVIASMQPIHCTADIVYADANWGERSRLAYAWSSLLASGAVLAFGSDAPVETPDILQGIYAAVTRRPASADPSVESWYPEECVSAAEAVYAYTMGAAYSAGEEVSKGSITPGKLADIVVLDRDIVAEDANAILEADVMATMVGGQFVYQKITLA